MMKKIIIIMKNLKTFEKYSINESIFDEETEPDMVGGETEPDMGDGEIEYDEKKSLISKFKDFFKNDWETIKTFSQDFESYIEYDTEYGKAKTEKQIETSYYYIQYSNKKNITRIKKVKPNRITKPTLQKAINFKKIIDSELSKGNSIKDFYQK